MFSTIQPKLVALSAIPLSLAIYFLGSIISSSYTTYSDMDDLLVKSRISVKINDYLHEMQKERGATSLYLSGKRHNSEALGNQYKKTDVAQTNLVVYMESLPKEKAEKDSIWNSLSEVTGQWSNVPQFRRSVANSLVSYKDSIEFYNQLNADLIKTIDKTIKTADIQLGEISRAYLHFIRGKEYSGRERALMSRVFSEGGFRAGEFSKFSDLVNLQDYYVELFKSNATKKQNHFYEQTLDHPVVTEVAQMRQEAFSSGEVTISGGFDIDPNHWISITTERINSLQKVEHRIAKDITTVATRQQPDILVLHNHAATIANFLHETQKERGFSAAFLGSDRKAFHYDLSTQRQVTDYMRPDVLKALQGVSQVKLSRDLGDKPLLAVEKISEVDSMRGSIDSADISALAATEFYTDLNSLLLESIHIVELSAENHELHNQYVAYLGLLKAKERAGLERAVMSRVFTSDKLERSTLQLFTMLLASQDSFFEIFRSFATIEQTSYLDEVLRNTVDQDFQQMRDTVFEHTLVAKKMSVDPVEWFTALTQKIDLMKEVEVSLTRDLRERAIGLRDEALNVFTMLGLLAFVVVAVVLIAIYMITLSIRRPVEILSQGAELIGEGNLTHRVSMNTGSGREFQQLAASFNMMAERRQEAEERFRQLSEAGFEGITISRDGVVLATNPRMEEMFRAEHGSLTGRNLLDLFANECRAFVADHILTNQNEANRNETYEAIGLRSDGTEFPTELRVKETSYHEETAWITVFSDISDQRAAEQENSELQEQLVQTQKMEALGTLAGGIAHDFNNILSAISGYAELTSMQVPDNAPALESLQEILHGVSRAADLTGQILTFSREGDKQKVPVQFSSLIEDALKFLGPTLPATIKLIYDNKLPSSTVFADPNQLHQILMNLCSNAATAMREHGGTLELKLDEVRTHESDRSPESGSVSGMHIKLTIRDTGEGIQPENIDRIFDPFFTTDKFGKGTGLGLAVVHSIVADHGGTIAVDSSVDKGTTFTVLLPRHEGPGPVDVDASNTLKPGSENVLLVDDEVAITLSYKSLLESIGYNVVTTNSSLRALQLFKEQSTDFDIVVTDQTMPDLTGDELATEILKIRPEIPIVLCSGFSEKVDESTALKAGISSYLQKPISLLTLTDTVRSVLDAH